MTNESGDTYMSDEEAVQLLGQLARYFEEADALVPATLTCAELALDLFDSVPKEMVPLTLAQQLVGRKLIPSVLGIELHSVLVGDDSGYEPDDPKHPTYHDRMSDLADL